MFDRARFIEQFKAETQEHIQKITAFLLSLEKAPQQKSLLEAVMGEMHTVKGSSVMMGYKRITDIAHKIEDGLKKALHGKIKMSKKHFDTIFECLDAFKLLLEDKLVWEDKGVGRPFIEELCGRIGQVFQDEEKAAVELSSPEAKSAPPDDLVLPAVSASWQPTDSLVEKNIRVDISKLDSLMNLSGELLIAKTKLDALVKAASRKIENNPPGPEEYMALLKDLEVVDEDITNVTSNIQSEVSRVRMISVSYLFNAFPRAMRDLAHEAGKEVDIEIRGEDTELDKRIIDQMKEPLMHILRNCVDHAIELPLERAAKNKPRIGKVILNAYSQGSQVVIEVSDDGNGIDPAVIKEAAVKKGLISPQASADIFGERVYELLFLPGFSTSEKVTEISGRGVGLDVVRKNIAGLKGTIEVNSKFGFGTNFIMKMPLTLAITESLLVTSGNEVFAIPIEAVAETIRVTQAQINTVESKEAVNIRGNIIPLVRLSDIFKFPPRGITEKKYFPVVIAQSVEKKIALLVDSLIGRQEIVRKNLGEPLADNIAGISGATILGDGRVVLILNIASIIESAQTDFIRRESQSQVDSPRKKKNKLVLLVEDTLTTAMLEKNILESAGFSVVIARDGKEALEKAAQEKFDLVLTDVMMPRMDGFELTRLLKADKIYKDIPVIIITTKDSELDKRKGLEAGAEAYIVKSEFSSEGLLEIIERLIG